MASERFGSVDARARVELEQAARSGDTVQAGHADVHQHDVRGAAPYDGDGLLAVGGLAHHRDVGLGLQHHAQPGSDHRLIVGHYHTRRGAGAAHPSLLTGR